jgi:hypothetical protein
MGESPQRPLDQKIVALAPPLAVEVKSPRVPAGDELAEFEVAVKDISQASIMNLRLFWAFSQSPTGSATSSATHAANERPAVCNSSFGLRVEMVA